MLSSTYRTSWSLTLAAFTTLQAACMAMTPNPKRILNAGIQEPPAAFMRQGKRLVYEDSGGTGPVVICLPGLGDTRGQYRMLAPRLAAAGYRVITLDPRGQGDSDIGWDSYTPESLGDDTAVMIESLGITNAYIVGNSYGAAVAAWVATIRPEAVRGIVLIGPFVRNVPLPWYQRVMLRAAFAGPWAPGLWESHYKSLYPVSQPTDLDGYAAALKANLREPGRLDVLRAMMWASKGPVAERLNEVRAPTLVIMGTADPDFADPEAEAHAVARLLPAKIAMVPGAGHYPHVDAPEPTLGHLTRFFDAHE